MSKLATMFIKYDMNERWMRALMDMDLTDSSSRQLSECQYLESLVFRLGDKVDVRVKQVNLDDRKIDLELLSAESPSGKSRMPKGHKGQQRNSKKGDKNNRGKRSNKRKSSNKKPSGQKNSRGQASSKGRNKS